MDDEFYERIIKDFCRLRAKYGICMFTKIIEDLEKKHTSINKKTLISIVCYIIVQDTKKQVFCTDWDKLYNEYMKDGNMLSLSNRYKLPPTILAKRLLPYLKDEESNNQVNLKKSFNNTCSIPDGKLAYDLMLCQYMDSTFGQHALYINKIDGAYFEQEIANILKSSNIDFETEMSMRDKGYDVTPDFKLNIPISLKMINEDSALIIKRSNLTTCSYCDPQNEEDNQYEIIVNWIECKSLFASMQCHKVYWNNQYSSYTNRFGRGVIIYRYGCVKSVLKHNSNLIILKKLYPS